MFLDKTFGQIENTVASSRSTSTVWSVGVGKRVQEPRVGAGNGGSGRVRVGSYFKKIETGRAGAGLCEFRVGPVPKV